MAIGDPLARWERRLDWSGESDVDGAVLLQRFEELHGAGSTRTMGDAADPGAIRRSDHYTYCIFPG